MITLCLLLIMTIVSVKEMLILLKLQFFLQSLSFQTFIIRAVTFRIISWDFLESCTAYIEICFQC